MQSTDIDLKEVVGIIRRQRRLLGIAFVLTLIPAILYLVMATPMYQATALISIDAGGSNLLDPGAIESSQSAILNSRVDGEVEVLRADATVLAVVERADLMRDPEFGPRLGLGEKIAIALGLENIGDQLRRAVGLREAEPTSRETLLNQTILKLKSATDVRRRGLTYLIAVTVKSEHAQRAAEIANLYVEAYIDEQVRTKSASVIAARDVLRSQTETAREELARLEAALNGFIDDNLARLEAESDNAAISVLRRELEAAQATKTQNAAVLATLREATARRDWLTAAESLGDAALQDLAREREAIARRLSGETAGSQVQIDLAAVLADLEQDLDTRLEDVQGRIEADLSAITRNETTAREQLREALLQSDLSSSVIADLYNLQQSALIARDQYQQLLARVQNLNAMANVQIADARIVSAALPQLSPVSPNKRLIIALAITSALGVGVLVAFLNEYYIGGITSTQQLANVSQTRALVAIPDHAAAGAGRMIADEIITAPLSQYSESFRKLRLAIDTTLHNSTAARSQDEGERRSGKLILVCSALPGEGKTTSAIALARTYAVAGQRTLLIDCDLRKPSVEGHIHAPKQEGLIDYLVSEQGDDEQIVSLVQDQVSGLMVVIGGARSTQPTDQLLNSSRFASLIDVVRDAFDVVVLDSPPLLPVVDTRYLAQMADAAVLIVRFANTTQGEVREAASQLQDRLRPGVSMISVLNRQSANGLKRDYYSGAYSGHSGDRGA